MRPYQYSLKVPGVDPVIMLGLFIRLSLTISKEASLQKMVTWLLIGFGLWGYGEQNVHNGK